MTKKVFVIAVCFAAMAGVTSASITQGLNVDLSAREAAGDQLILPDGVGISKDLDLVDNGVLEKVDCCVGLTGPASVPAEDVLIGAEGVAFEQGSTKMIEIMTTGFGFNHNLMLSALPSN